jgi:DNA-binding NarL/FixJ family response regulator
MASYLSANALSFRFRSYQLEGARNALFNFMASLPEKTEQWGAVLEYVEKHLGEVGEEQLDPKEVAVWLKRRGKSERAIADLVQRSPSTVHDWVTSTGSKKTEQRIS